MPITCPLTIRPLEPDEFERIDYRVMGHAFACQNELGRLCEEGVYQRDVQARLRADRFRSVEIEVPVVVAYADFSRTYFVDLIVDHAVYELKTTTGLTSEHEAQLLHYLFLLGIPRGKLINFRPSQVQGRLHATALTELQAIQWINLNQAEIQLVTLDQRPMRGEDKGMGTRE